MPPCLPHAARGPGRQSLFTFCGLNRLDTQTLSRIATRYPAAVGELTRNMAPIPEPST